MSLEFEAFPKIGRLNRKCTITEKIDGTNAQIVFDEVGNMLVGSRKRQIYPEGTLFDADGTVIKGTDNMGFAQWAYSLQDTLFDYLGAGRHYGEWAGAGIQRGYGLTTKRFYLFNTFRWDDDLFDMQGQHDIGLFVVPTLYTGDYSVDMINDIVKHLPDNAMTLNGTTFHNPEGVIVYHHGTRTYAKVTCKKDNEGKGRDDQSPS